VSATRTAQPNVVLRVRNQVSYIVKFVIYSLELLRLMTQNLLVLYKHIYLSKGLQVTKTKLHKS